MRRERLIRPTKLCKFNILHESNRTDRRSTSHGVTFVIAPPLFLIAPRLLHWIDNQHSESTVVRRLTSPRLEFEAAAIYEYPEHLRSFLNDLPTRPGCICFMAKVTPCRSISAKALTFAAASFLIYVPRMKPPCYGNPGELAGFAPQAKSALCSLKRD